MYAVEPDPYCYPDSEVLINLPGLRSAERLAAFELVATTQRADEPLPAGRLGARHYCRVHHHLFQDVYSWAGEFRTVRLAKAGSMFCYPEHIPDQMARLFGFLRGEHFLAGLERDLFIQGLTRFLSELNAIHPFREGNGRSQLTFAALLAYRAGWEMDLARLNPDAILLAMIESFHGNEMPLRNELARLV
ncbi:filamentation induced by cAMP protein Fic [Glycocaulis alkaliphilus]|uniref:protein adenylyltransferase n=1 Tax=Glycocaulis alkaliphilus TaxID=1434191 RepID=A0A3T0E8F1_9PROT|nr:Fic family protein [Glycocaulis alkaliphilus]AZU03685.1 filamentation induced by cAMP protein Fic [Glycocaulis alkaliphilus]GGB83165.1 putative adenosine monophosphate-protein transferase y4lH [Glycocaulis alkaliphilus]